MKKFFKFFAFLRKKQAIFSVLSLFSLFLSSPIFSAAPQDNWYLDRFDTFGYAWGMRHPIALAHGTNGRTFVVEFDKDRVQFRDENQTIINLKGCGDNPRAITYAEGKVYVVSEDSERVYVFDEKGKSSSHSGQRVPAMANLKILTVLLPVITETTWRFL